MFISSGRENNVIVQINIDIDGARKTLETCAGSLQEMQLIQGMSDDEIKNLVLKHSKCWGISEVKSM